MAGTVGRGATLQRRDRYPQTRPDVRPIQVGLSTFALENGTYYHTLMAASAFTIAPVLIVFILIQRHFLESIARSGLKG